MSQFAAPHQSLAGLDAESTAALIAAAADVALVIDGQGIIRDVSVASAELELVGHEQWVGRTWSDTVTIESRPKVEALLKDAGNHATRRWRHLNHPSSEGSDVPVLYSAIQVGEQGRVIAFGRDMRALATLQQRLVSAQQSIERDYLRLRYMETRYRLLFETVSEAVLVIDATTHKVLEANPAAARMMGLPLDELVGRGFAECFDDQSSQGLAAFIGGARATGRAEDARLHLAVGGEVNVAASLIRQDQASLLLVRMSTQRTDADGQTAGAPQSNPLGKVLEQVPDAFVVTDKSGQILAANNAFVELVQMPSADLVQGQALDRWLGRSGVDLSVLTTNLRRHGSIRLFATTMRGEYGTSADVEISAISVPDGDRPCFGFTIRDVGRRLSDDPRARQELPRSVEQLTDLVGRVPLKDIVNETTDLIEQLCIEAALQLTRGNRASASEMLGLSRQSLYVKLRRYGLNDGGVNDGAERPES